MKKKKPSVTLAKWRAHGHPPTAIDDSPTPVPCFQAVVGFPATAVGHPPTGHPPSIIPVPEASSRGQGIWILMDGPGVKAAHKLCHLG